MTAQPAPKSGLDVAALDRTVRPQDDLFTHVNAADGLTADERFFIAYARIWRTKEREAYLRQWVITQPHAPGSYRVNGIVAHVPAFSQAFAVKPGDRLFRDSATRVTIW